MGDRYHKLAETHLARGLPVLENHVSLVEREDWTNFINPWPDL